VSIIPVVRCDDDAESLAAYREVGRRHGEGFMLRLGGVDRDPDAAEAAENLPSMLALLGAEVEQVQLLVDYGPMDSERVVERTVPAVLQFLTWATEYPWRGVTLAAGAFPESITNFAYGEPGCLPRYDALFWRRVTDLLGERTNLGYGDYGVSHPSYPQQSAQNAPAPSLRYTRGESWSVYRRKKTPERGNEAFYDICREVVEDLDWVGPDFSWGDRELWARRDARLGPGNATKWRAWATSHHIETVRTRLASLGAP
jgi:hypothetical protein